MGRRAPMRPDGEHLANGEHRPLLAVEGVSKRFGSFLALMDVDLTVDAGEVVVVIGPSGSGKSTLCRTINRLETHDGGRILLDGRELPQEGKDLARLRADVGMVFQSLTCSRTRPSSRTSPSVRSR